jgi:hypothetical protein
MTAFARILPTSSGEECQIVGRPAKKSSPPPRCGCRCGSSLRRAAFRARAQPMNADSGSRHPEAHYPDDRTHLGYPNCISWSQEQPFAKAGRGGPLKRFSAFAINFSVLGPSSKRFLTTARSHDYTL